jgi:hypothetical protein
MFSSRTIDACRFVAQGYTRIAPVRGVNRLWVMPRDDVISEAPDRIQIPARREELEGADTDVARRDAGQYRAGQRRLAPNRLAGRHSGEDDVFAQDRPERRASVAPAMAAGVTDRLWSNWYRPKASTAKRRGSRRSL